MELEAAKSKFQEILSTLGADAQKEQFFFWIQREYIGDQQPREYKILDKISSYLKKKYPYGSSKLLSASEKLPSEVSGINASSDLAKTIEIDGFIFDDDDLDQLADEGRLQRWYCKDCDSTNVQPFNLITHSVSRETLHEIFGNYLSAEQLRGKTILDVGSRIGAFLYGAYVYSSDARIVGVEMNAELCAIQRMIIDKFKFNDRIEVVNADVLNCAELVSTSDFIFLHNVFEFFVSDDDQRKIWQFLKQNIKKGAILITIPSLEAMTSGLLEETFLENWLVQLTASLDDADESKVYLYEVP